MEKKGQRPSTRPQPRPGWTEEREVFLPSGLSRETEEELARALPGLDAGALFVAFRDVAAILGAWQANDNLHAPSAQETRRSWGKVSAHASKLLGALDELGGQAALERLRALQPAMVAPRKRAPDPFKNWWTVRDGLLRVALTARFLAAARRGGTKRHNWPLGLAVAALVGVFVRANRDERNAERRRLDFVSAGLQAAPAGLWGDGRDDRALVRDYLKRIKVDVGSNGFAYTYWEPEA